MLRTIKLGEADRIVTILTQGHGKIRAVAKGIRKTTSKFGARLEPMSRVALQCYRGRELDIVTQVETLDANRALREEYALLTHAVPMLEAVDQVAQEREPNPALYRMLTGALAHARRAPQPARHARVLLEAALARGLPPDARRLRPLRRADGRRGDEHELVAFDLDEGGMLCRACARGGGRPVTPDALDAAAPHARRRAQRRARRDAGPGGARGRAARHPGARAPRRAPAALRPCCSDAVRALRPGTTRAGR